jgi:hypothetical protein
MQPYAVDTTAKCSVYTCALAAHHQQHVEHKVTHLLLQLPDVMQLPRI